MWRWSRLHRFWSNPVCVFSTYVEVILPIFHSDGSTDSILHVCGGDPKSSLRDAYVSMYSPRMWRWSLAATLQEKNQAVFSTYVEVILSRSQNAASLWCILHVCGGDPWSSVTAYPLWVYSPRMWRWSYLFVHLRLKVQVFSTYVEVIPWCKLHTSMNQSILHVCGGDPRDEWY